MSDILDIYTSIANMEVGSIKSRNIDKINLTVRDGSLPLRLLMPATEGDMDFVALGTLQKITWVIQDLCLWAPVTQGKGIEQFSKAMVEYLSLYMEQVKANRNPAGQSCILGVAAQMMPILWNEKKYWGVNITLTVEEIL
jgi:hypothetical protein